MDVLWVANSKQATSVWRQELGSGMVVVLQTPQGYLDGAEGKGARSIP